MRKFAIILASVALLFAALPASDSFTGVNGTSLPTHNAAWVEPVGGFVIEDNAARPQNAGAYSVAAWTGDAFANDQYSETVILDVTTGTFIGPAVRMNSGTGDAYVLLCDGTDFFIQELAAGAFVATLVSVPTAIVGGDTIRLEVSGTTLTGKLNGATILSVSDATYASGDAGIAGYNLGYSRADSWVADNLAAASTRRRAIFFQ